MKKIIKKIKSILTETKYGINQITGFGFKYGLSFFTTMIFVKYRYKTRLRAIDILDKEFGYIFRNNINKDYAVPAIDNEQKNIFVFWAQGFDNLPYLQSEAVKRIKFYYADYNIILLDLNNYSKYVKLDDNILKLFKRGKISIQTFSDILRFNLLYKIGGIWCDATLMFFKKYPLFEDIQKYGFWSINHDSSIKRNLWGKVYDSTYATFFLGTHKGNDVMKACVEFYDAFYKKHTSAIDYFMNDYMLILTMKYHIDNDILRKIPFNNGTPFYLADVLKNKAVLDLTEIKKMPQKLNRRSTNERKLKKYLEIIDSRV